MLRACRSYPRVAGSADRAGELCAAAVKDSTLCCTTPRPSRILMLGLSHCATQRVSDFTYIFETRCAQHVQAFPANARSRSSALVALGPTAFLCACSARRRSFLEYGLLKSKGEGSAAAKLQACLEAPVIGRARGSRSRASTQSWRCLASCAARPHCARLRSVHPNHVVLQVPLVLALDELRRWETTCALNINTCVPKTLPRAVLRSGPNLVSRAPRAVDPDEP